MDAIVKRCCQLFMGRFIDSSGGHSLAILLDSLCYPSLQLFHSIFADILLLAELGHLFIKYYCNCRVVSCLELFLQSSNQRVLKVTDLSARFAAMFEFYGTKLIDCIIKRCAASLHRHAITLCPSRRLLAHRWGVLLESLKSGCGLVHLYFILH